MQTTRPIPKRPLRVIAAVLAVALISAFGFSFLGCRLGFLFSGISILYVTLLSGAVGMVLTTVTDLLLRRRQQLLGWRSLLFVTVAVAFVAVIFLSWRDMRQQLRIFVNPSPVPSGLSVHHGRNTLFSAYVHFSGPPPAIASLLESKDMVEVSVDPSATSDDGAFSSRERTKVPRDWWQPAAMSNPRFFFRHNNSEAAQGWSEGWWVNGATNEVYAFVSN